MNRLSISHLLAAALAAGGGVAAGAVDLVRGPYLQGGTPTSAVVRWRTDAFVDGWVAWGMAPGQHSGLVHDLTPRLDHEVLVGGLEAETTYYYAVGFGSVTLAGGDANHFFRTAPPPGEIRPTRVWVIGDSGTGNSVAGAVRDAYLGFTGARHTDVWLMLGDNAYPDGTDAEYQRAVFDTYPTLLRTTFLWPSLGNHDAHSAESSTQSGPYFDNFTLPDQAQAGGVASGTEAYYAFDFGAVHFVGLDTADSSLAADGPMLQWLQADLDGSDQPWLIAYFHHPPYTHGSHDSDDPGDSGGRMFDVREVVLPILEAAGVDLVLAGHSHVYERSFLLDGHYGTSDTLDPATMIVDGGDGSPAGDGAYRMDPRPHSGTLYAVVGASGTTSGGPLDHPAMFMGLNISGSLVVDVDGDRLSAVYLDDQGAVLDSFELVKRPPAIFADGFESGDTAAWGGAGVER